MGIFGRKVHNESNAEVHKDAHNHHGLRDVVAAGGVDYALRHHEKSEDKKHPEKTHDHKARDAALAGGVGLGLHEHDKHKREAAIKEEEARHSRAAAAATAPGHHTHANNAAVPATAAAGTAAAGHGAYGANGVNGVNGATPSNSHARSLKTKGKMDSFFGGMFCSHSMKMRGIERQQAANREYKQVAHLREADRLHAQANAHARAAGVA
ncbi:hypothetical protein K450DRAFT_238492 [Umbelopsis ramanniana AG]|uniref:Uncharacterized protein n=1 Tax=Umbelopsis ramanniana AG TaxID=1314678 RepID=A0AAD5HEK8_UMBRA|nr:uncharacterized protein K450DRAFT_238492 [Umbelopsis ramanniana AG]KAI8580169.1 hypothetical protein K450DRAFT_238492 [Umbelopsis ramanniana AG]